jgi:hypothetical protein
MEPEPDRHWQSRQQGVSAFRVARSFFQGKFASRTDYDPCVRFLILAVLVGLTFSLPARAEEPAPEEKLRDEAIRLMEEGRIADARDIHVSLWRLHKRPIDAFNSGMLSYRVHDWIRAAEYLTLWLDLEPPPAPSAPEATRRKRERARTDLEDTLRHVGAIAVHVSEPGAEVLVDGRRAGTSPLRYPVFVTPGEHRLVARRDGARSEEVTIKAEARAEHTVRLVLRDGPAPVAVQTPARKKEDAVKPAQGQEAVKPAPEPPSTKAPAVSPRGAALLAGSGAIAGAGLLLVAAGFHWEAVSQGIAIRENAGPGGCREDAYRATCDDLQDTIMVRDALFGGAVVSWVAAGGFAVGLAVSNWLGPPTPQRQGIRVLPAVGSAGVGVKAVW